MSICEEKCGQFFLNWNRWSDNCSGQFKSRNTLGKFVEAAKSVLCEDATGDCNVSWEFLEANEAKNESDTIGGFSKTALRKAILKDPDIVIRTADDMVEIIQRGLEKCLTGSEKYKFVHVETIPMFDREKVPVEIPIKGIRSLHSFSMVDGGVLSSQLSCLQCTVAAKCSSCCKENLSVIHRCSSSGDSEEEDVEEDDDEDSGEEGDEAELEESDAESGDDIASD